MGRLDEAHDLVNIFTWDITDSKRRKGLFDVIYSCLRDILDTTKYQEEHKRSATLSWGIVLVIFLTFEPEIVFSILAKHVETEVHILGQVGSIGPKVIPCIAVGDNVRMKARIGIKQRYYLTDLRVNCHIASWDHDGENIDHIVFS